MSFNNIRGNKIAQRSILLASAAGLTLAISAPAQAQDASAVKISSSFDGFNLSTTTTGNRISITDGLISRVAPVAIGGNGHIDAVAPTAQGAGYVDAVAPTPQTTPMINPISSVSPTATSGYVKVAAPDRNILVVTPAPGDPDPSLDSGVTGIGQMIVDQQNGYLGLCTGTLINPRTVIFAAHCVNDDPATAYGSNSGGKPIAFGFEANTVPGLVNWYFGTHQTDTAHHFYNVNQVRYNDTSLQYGGFLQADVALASLDTPAAGVPTWALLFSQLPDPGPIGADGTGYHVQLVGYGNHGYGTSGSVGIDYRRRAAENMLGALTSLDNFEGFLFGSPPSGLNQNLYFLDFDDPNRGTPAASPYDFNAFRDNATPLEGITASGDSGGPLILDNTFDKSVVIGVLSGGYTRFFTSQPANGYGTVSFYQPLYLYWDWIAANNPYHYVSAKAGDGQWTDPTHWVTNLDPAYQVIGADGNLVNGIPTTPGEGVNGSSGQFGQACYQAAGLSDCYDFGTGVETFDPSGHPIGTAGNGNLTVSVDSLGLGAGTSATAQSSGTSGSTGAGATQVAVTPTLPDPTLGNGLPGATDFVPSNYDGDRVNGIMARYFDVTLSAAGTTTLSNAQIIVDNLTVSGADSGLVIDSNALLISWLGLNQYAGHVTVNGDLLLNSDYTLMGGMLSGTGNIYAPFTTSVTGLISPGTENTVGTLNFNGNLILASGSGYLVNLAGAGRSDLIAVHTTQTDTSGAPLDGMANLGGTVIFAGADSGTPRYGDHYTIVTAEGGVSGQFDQVMPISAILVPKLTYGANSVTVDVDALSYTSVINSSDPVQSAYAQLLDQNRAQYSKYSNVYGTLDLLSQSSIQLSLDNLAPRSQNAGGLMSIAATNALGNFFRTRLNTVAGGDTGGTVAMMGQPVQLAALSLNAMPGAAPVRSDAGNGMAVRDNALPDTMAIYLAGGYINGKGTGLPSPSPVASGGSTFDGFFIAGGIEGTAGPGTTIGFGLGYVDTTGSTKVIGDRSKGRLYQGTLYAMTHLGNIRADAQVSAGAYQLSAMRTAMVGTTVYNLRGDDSAFAFASEVGLSSDLGAGAFTVTPRVSLRYNLIEFNNVAETGGGPALQYNLGNFSSLEGRAGFTLRGTAGGFKPFLTANYVHDFDPRPGAFTANFVGGIGPSAVFGLTGADKDWAELSGGVNFQLSQKVDGSIAADTTVGRSDVSNQTYRASVTFHF